MPADALLALQRTVGNQAVAGLLAHPAGRSLARMTVADDAKLLSTLKVTKGAATRPHLRYPQYDVDVYEGTAGTKASRLEALQYAAEVSGTVAAAVAEHYETVFGALAANDERRKKFSPTWPWTSLETTKVQPAKGSNKPVVVRPPKLRDVDVLTFDPFQLEVTCAYTKDSAQHSLTLAFQHGDDLNGYVTSLKDTGNPAAATGVKLIDVQEAKPVPDPTAAGGVNPPPSGAPATAAEKYVEYGVAHDEKRDENLLEMTGGADDKSFDAYTKLAGEGSRWESVRKHAAHLRNSSRFFVKMPTDPNKPADPPMVRAIEFKSLWKQWNKRFKQVYNIPDAELAKYLRGESKEIIRDKALSDMTEFDYDVDAGSQHKPGAKVTT